MAPECHDPDTCARIARQLSAFLDGELEACAREKILRHAGACTACRVCLETLRRTIALCRCVASIPVPGPFRLRLARAIDRLVRGAAPGGAAGGREPR